MSPEFPFENITLGEDVFYDRQGPLTYSAQDEFEFMSFDLYVQKRASSTASQTPLYLSALIRGSYTSYALDSQHREASELANLDLAETPVVSTDLEVLRKARAYSFGPGIGIDFNRTWGSTNLRIGAIGAYIFKSGKHRGIAIRSIMHPYVVSEYGLDFDEITNTWLSETEFRAFLSKQSGPLSISAGFHSWMQFDTPVVANVSNIGARLAGLSFFNQSWTVEKNNISQSSLFLELAYRVW